MENKEKRNIATKATIVKEIKIKEIKTD